MPKRTSIPSGVGRQIAIVRRGLMDFKQEKLADMTGIGLRTLQRIEGEGRVCLSDLDQGAKTVQPQFVSPHVGT